MDNTKAFVFSLARMEGNQTETYQPLHGYTFSSFSIILFLYVFRYNPFPLSCHFIFHQIKLYREPWTCTTLIRFEKKRIWFDVNKSFPIGFAFFLNWIARFPWIQYDANIKKDILQRSILPQFFSSVVFFVSLVKKKQTHCSKEIIALSSSLSHPADFFSR